MMRLKFDNVIIGSGPGGQSAAIQSVKAGKKTLIIDNREYKLGGVSLHSGTIPSKTLREAVLYLRGLRRKKVYGQSRRFQSKISLTDLMERVEIILRREMEILEGQLKRNKVDVMFGQASFIDPFTLQLTSRERGPFCEVRAGKIIVAVGTNPRHPPEIPFDYRRVFDSDFIFSSRSRIDELPERLIIYGAGVIGSEYALMFGALGVEVRLIDSHRELFPFMDQTVVNLLKEQMKETGVELLMGNTLQKVEKPDSGGVIITTDTGLNLEADALLFSKGRIPATGPLLIQRAGVKLSDRGEILVNQNYQSSVEHIYACGDVVGYPALASTSAFQGRVAALCALGESVSDFELKLFPVAIYTIPEISSLGKTEKQLQEEGREYIVGLSHYNEIAKACIAGDDTGLLKILVNPADHKILGIHAMGDQVAEIIHIGMMVMLFEGKIDTFVNNVFNYPTWAEVYRTAAFDALKKL